jgi:hypothetical protein
MESLLDDLGALGLHFEFRQGVDWGYGNSLQAERDGKYSLYITPDAMSRLVSHGVRDLSFANPSNSKLKLLPVKAAWKRIYKMTFRAQLVTFNSDHSQPRALWKVVGDCGDSGFGSQGLRYHMGQRTVAMFHREIEEWICSLRG